MEWRIKDTVSQLCAGEVPSHREWWPYREGAGCVSLPGCISSPRLDRAEGGLF